MNNPLHQKREIEGVEILNAILMTLDVAKEHPNEDLADILVHGMLYILYDPDLNKKNLFIAKEREKRATESISIEEKLERIFFGGEKS